MTSRIWFVLMGGLAVSVASGCDKRDEPAVAAPSAAASVALPAAPVRAGGDKPAWQRDLDKTCDSPAAAPAAVKQHLGLEGNLTVRSYSNRVHAKCVYSGSLDVTIEVDTGSPTLDSVRRAFEPVGKPEDYPGFGDQAFSVTTSATNVLCVVKDRITFVVTARAPLDKLRALATALYADMGVRI